MILGNTYVFYGDVYFVWNFLIKITTLILITVSFGKRIELSVKKIIFLAGAASIAEMIALCFVIYYAVFVVVINVFEMPFMVYLLLSQDRRIIGKGIIRGYIFTILINGVLEILWNQFGETGSYFLIIVVACIGVFVGYSIYCKTRNREKGVLAIELKHMGKVVKTYGLYDSGNCLKDPYTGKGVHIVSENLIVELISREMNKVMVPYHALGTSADLIEAVYIDEIVIYGKEEIIRQHKIPIGIAKEEMFLNKSYKMILNEEVF